ADLREYSITDLGAAPAGAEMLRGFRYATISVVPAGTIVEKNEKIDEIRATLQEQLAEVEGFEKLHVKGRGTAEVDERDVVAVYVSGGDRIAFGEIQDHIRDAIASVENVTDIFMDESRFQRSLQFVPDEAAILAYELSTQQVAAELREHFSNREVARVRLQGKEVEVFTGFSNEPDPTPKELAKLSIISPRGVAVPLRFLGEWQQTDVLRRIEHKDTLRMFRVDVLYDHEEVTVEEVADGIEASLVPVREAFPSYYISVKPSEKEAETRAWAIQVGIICLGLIYLALALSLNSLVQPVVVIFSIPFGFVGVVLALFLHGMPLEMMSIIGLLGLAGVVVNDSLVMTSTINEVRQASPEGSAKEAVVQGASGRFQALILTSLTTLGGVLPLAYGLGGEAGWIQPMVFALGWGLLFATVLTLYVIPSLVYVIDDFRRGGRWGWGLIRRRGGASR
ncbi:MAG: efflux RND transporter permease subunit, partial [Proteobacteria bacterium]|nr:efflux RND transporter permease subunit [Pseudomonadota bacterium]